jgi:simple sugar transport system substrate-binding protein
MRKTAPDAQIVAVTHQWDRYYLARAQAVLKGTWKSANLWGGIKDGMVAVTGFGSKVPPAVQTEVLARQKDIAAGRLHPFQAPQQAAVLDNQGRVRIAAAQTLSDAQILAMDWLVQGVQGQLP